MSLRCVLVANRGEIARRVFRSAAARGMRTVAVYSDADAGAPFVREADLAVQLPGTSPAETYLRGELIVEAARQAGADCIHPGYGFLSENAEFAHAVQAAGLVWVGPPTAAIEAMGSKLGAKALMAEAGVPTAPSADATGLSGEALLKAGAGVGYPLLVKASFGGGGRGMRTVSEAAQLADAVSGAAREAASAFGDGTVFLERLVRPARHVEVQIFGDCFGTVVALHERECSVQRRHQKVIEEAPSPAVDGSLRERLRAAAVRAGKAIGYVGAGTVEFLLGPEGNFYFLEVNTRLQVEHPVTEAVTGLDLVDLQFAVAAGEPLPTQAREPRLVGAAIEARLYAEDPARDWLPQSGSLDGFAMPHLGAFAGVGVVAGGAVRGVRLDSGVESGSTVGVAYDPMLAKVIAWAPDRTVASAILASALRQAEISGLVTNRDLLVRVLESAQWLAGETDTDFFHRVGLDSLAAPLVCGDELARCLLAAALGQGLLRRRDARVLAGLPWGWRNNPSVPQTVAYTVSGHEGTQRVVRYAFDRSRLSASVDEVAVEAQLLSAEAIADGSARITFDCHGIQRSYEAHVVHSETPAAAGFVGRVHVRGADGWVSFAEIPRFPEPSAAIAPGSLTASMPGSVVRVLVEEGDVVAAGQAIVVLEAMKMEHTIAAPADGTVTSVAVSAGAQVETGSLLAVVAEEEL